MGRQQHSAPIIVPQTTPRHKTLNRKKREEDAPLSERFLSMYLTSARRLRLTPEVNSGCAPAVGRAPDVARGPSALRNDFPGCNCAPDLGVPSKNLEISSLLTRIRPRRNPCRPPQVGAAAHTCTESAARTAHAKHSSDRSLSLPDVTSATRSASALPPDLPKQL